MEQNKEGLEPQKTPEAVTPTEVSLSQKEYDDLKHRAEVSSQNFERLKKAEEEKAALSDRLANLSSNQLPVEYEDEVVGKLKNEVSEIKTELQKRDVLEAYPQLKEVWSEFDSFRNDPENLGMSMKTAAKAFVVEKELTDTPKRKGLEKPTGGGHTPIQSGMSSDDVKKLRETNYKKYVEMLKKG